MLDRKIYCIWFGQEMSPNRKNCFDSIQKNTGVEIILITNSNLHEYEIKEFPIHKGFEFLSDTHKSDYLRSYLMYNFGSGYTDIKFYDYDWNPYFEQLENSDKYFIGYREKARKDIEYNDAKPYFNSLVGNGAYIFKPKSLFAHKWITAVNNKMDLIYDTLKAHPGNYHPRAIKGGCLNEKNLFKGSKYPLEWSELCGRIFHRLQLEHQNEYLFDLPYINTSNYR